MRGTNQRKKKKNKKILYFYSAIRKFYSLDDIIRDIESQKADLKEIFDKRTKNKKKVPIVETGDILDDFSVQLALDCEGAKKFFNNNNSQIPANINTE